MKSKTLKITLISIIIGLYLAFNFRYFSGMNPLIGIILKIFILTLLIFSMILILKEPNRKQKLIQCTILITCIGIGLFGNYIMDNNENDNSLRTYLYDKVE